MIVFMTTNIGTPTTIRGPISVDVPTSQFLPHFSVLFILSSCPLSVLQPSFSFRFMFTCPSPPALPNLFLLVLTLPCTPDISLPSLTHTLCTCQILVTSCQIVGVPLWSTFCQLCISESLTYLCTVFPIRFQTWTLLPVVFTWPAFGSDEIHLFRLWFCLTPSGLLPWLLPGPVCDCLIDISWFCMSLWFSSH